jgi:hypothetical protein
VPWEKAFYSELPKPTGIGHSVGHQVPKLLPDDNPQFTILGIMMGKSARVGYMPVHQLDHCHMGTMSYPRYR